MPTIKLDINTGIEYSPTDGIDAGVKLHNFTVGTDGSLYKLPALKNLKNTTVKKLTDTFNTCYFTYPILDIKKFQTSAQPINFTLPNSVLISGLGFTEMSMYRRFVYLTIGSYGIVNVDYSGNRDSLEGAFGEVEKIFFDVTHTQTHGNILDLVSLNPSILVDLNAVYDGDDNRDIDIKNLRCVFPCQQMFEGIGIDYPLPLNPRNVVSCSLDPTTATTDIKALIEEDEGKGSEKHRTKNDLARGCINIGNRMFFYSVLENAIYVSKINNFSSLQEETSSVPPNFKIIPTEEIQGITDFNGNIITFTPTGMDRWVLSDTKTMLERDPTFHYDHRIRYGGSFVKANRDLYFYTDDFQVYRLNSDLTVESVFQGILPSYEPLETYLTKEKDLPVTHFKMLGYRFISIGMWLYNIDSNTWSTYSYDGWKNPQQYLDKLNLGEKSSNDPSEYAWIDETNKRAVSFGYDDIICTYSTLCRALSYEEMQDALTFDDAEPSLKDPDYDAPTKRFTKYYHQWGEVAFITTRVYQDDRTFSLDGIEVYVRGGILPAGSKLWVKVLRGSDPGDFDINDEATYGVSATYEPIEASTLGEEQKEHTGKFIWHTNIKTDRFRLQFVCTEKRGIVIQSVMANITKISDSQEFLLRKQQQKEGKQ